MRNLFRFPILGGPKASHRYPCMVIVLCVDYKWVEVTSFSDSFSCSCIFIQFWTSLFGLLLGVIAVGATCHIFHRRVSTILIRKELVWDLLSHLVRTALWYPSSVFFYIILRNITSKSVESTSISKRVFRCQRLCVASPVSRHRLVLFSTIASWTRIGLTGNETIPKRQYAHVDVSFVRFLPHELRCEFLGSSKVIPYYHMVHRHLILQRWFHVFFSSTDFLFLCSYFHYASS